ncbi:hypothetical protein SLEP1_g23871 [Rubroshorea leprosula]|nr:hypothetical protein SLEP1_g23871 [Rubroshorea leprosula]
MDRWSGVLKVRLDHNSLNYYKVAASLCFSSTSKTLTVAAVALLRVQPEPSYGPLITDVLHSLVPLVPVELGCCSSSTTRATTAKLWSINNGCSALSRSTCSGRTWWDAKTTFSFLKSYIMSALAHLQIEVKFL